MKSDSTKRRWLNPERSASLYCFSVFKWYLGNSETWVCFMGEFRLIYMPSSPLWNLARKYAEEAQFILAPSTRELLISLCGTTRSVEDTSAAQSVEWLKEGNATVQCPNPYHEGMSEVPWESDRHTDRHTYTNTHAYTYQCISIHM